MKSATQVINRVEAKRELNEIREADAQIIRNAEFKASMTRLDADYRKMDCPSFWDIFLPWRW